MSDIEREKMERSAENRFARSEVSRLNGIINQHQMGLQIAQDWEHDDRINYHHRNIDAARSQLTEKVAQCHRTSDPNDIPPRR